MTECNSPQLQLLIEKACRDLVMDAAARNDAQDHAGLAALFTPDAVLERPGAAPLQGRAAIEASYRERPAERLTVHLVVGTRLTLSDDARASAVSQVLVWSGSRADEAGPMGRPAAARQAVGSFEDSFELTAEGWRIARRIARFALYRDQ